ncbi:uncharacterized protein LOC135200393 isoform X2 [Macrobrachium nipponense]|uniref:uncharacterized protein LOC135200393 isoform X2 n=1 Tax=Macrobrachium nipponense TaxID=159736 RepID=UPI0030C879CD
MMDPRGEKVPFTSTHEASSSCGGEGQESSDLLVHQNKLLSNKIQLIEMQNLEQQRRLQQLENLIMEITSAKSLVKAEQKSSSGIQQLDKLSECGGKVPVQCYAAGEYHGMDQKTLSHSDKLKTLQCTSRFTVKDSMHTNVPVGNYGRIIKQLSLKRKGNCSESDFYHSQFVKDWQVSSSGNEELGQSDDVLSIMEEFDRTARENGVMYSMTPEGSVISAEDLCNFQECLKDNCEVIGNCNSVDNADYDLDILATPASELLTPSFQSPAPTISQYPSENGPMITPQPCLTTPVLLTSEALRAVERTQDQQSNPAPRWGLRDRFPVPDREERKSSHKHCLDFKKRKMCLFSNLLSGLNQMASSCHENSSPEDDKSAKESCLRGQRFINQSNLELPSSSPAYSNKSISSSHVREWSQSMRHVFLSPMPESLVGNEVPQSPFCSPDSYSSTYIRDWSQSLKFGYLSPMSESHFSHSEVQLFSRNPCYGNFSSYSKHSDKDHEQSVSSLPHASEEEDLVVDEVVSLSMGGGSSACNSTTLNTRQRSESVCSVTGPCVPPDLLLNTGMHNVVVDNIISSDVEEEIAGLLDGDLPFEDSVIIPDDGIISAPQIKVEYAESKVRVKKEYDDLCQEDYVSEDTEGENEEQTTYNEDQIENAESLVETKAGGGFRNVADLIGNNSQIFTCKKIKSKGSPQEKTINVDGQDVKLQAGSIILAVVNESGTLVPLPQLPVKGSKFGRALKVESSPEKVSEEEIDVETVTEKAPVLEAGDLDSLLAQFEASEAVNTSGIEHNTAKIKNNTTSVPAVVTNAKIGRQTSVCSNSNTPQGSPVHQKIKNALPKEVIEKIKASTKRKSTQMLSEPLLVRKGRGIKQPETNQHRKKSHRSSPHAVKNITSDRVPPPLDHDYCCSPEKQKSKGNITENASQPGDYFNKLPDYYTVAASKNDNKKASATADDNHDDSGKKDSGVESGDVSDASVETEDRRKDIITVKCGAVTDNWDSNTKSDVHIAASKDEDVYDKLPPYMTDIGNTKPKVEVEVEVEEEPEKEVCEQTEQKQEVKKIKRKLNLSEYRQRIQSAHSSRCPSPNQTDALSKIPTTVPLSLGELIQKMKDAEKEKESVDTQIPEEKPEDPAVPVEDVEEGELKGDSDSEVLKASSTDDMSEKLSEVKTEVKLPFGSSVPASSPVTSSCRESRKSSSSQGYASRRWSSSSHSRSRSRSRSRSPRRKHSSHYRRSSRGRRKGTRRRSSRSSVSSCRSRSRGWSRSKSRSYSRSRGRSSSEYSDCSTCSGSSKSRSRSRSHSYRKRERSYSRRYSGNWDRRRRSRSWSRSSRYSRGHRSRSPSWRNSRRSRSSSRRPVRPRRSEDEDRLKQVEERRVIYVGRITEGTTKAELRRRFQKFGTILDISVHFRERGDNYGFVTYMNKDEAYNAVEHGNDDPSYPRYDLCFGGRRAFCRVQYSDLDAQDEGTAYLGGSMAGGNSNVDFDSLLRAAMKRKTR